jgi:hypothetical protein
MNKFIEASALSGTQNIFEDNEAVGLEETLRRRKIISAEAFHLAQIRAVT